MSVLVLGICTKVEDRFKSGQQRFKCRDCGPQFVENPTKKVIHQGTRSLIDRWRTEGIPQAGIAGAVQVPEPWLPNYVNQKYVSVRRQVQVRLKKRGFNNTLRQGVSRLVGKALSFSKCWQNHISA
ncbi:hypothetical protein HFV01_15390 [Limnospira fusiformis SAG 85.79]|nr:hypothetical protein HFV01_15390 [Limnospira fusiformis SAG 85.79]